MEDFALVLNVVSGAFQLLAGVLAVILVILRRAPSPPIGGRRPEEKDGEGQGALGAED